MNPARISQEFSRDHVNRAVPRLETVAKKNYQRYGDLAKWAQVVRNSVSEPLREKNDGENGKNKLQTFLKLKVSQHERLNKIIFAIEERIKGVTNSNDDTLKELNKNCSNLIEIRDYLNRNPTSNTEDLQWVKDLLARALNAQTLLGDLNPDEVQIKLSGWKRLSYAIAKYALSWFDP